MGCLRISSGKDNVNEGIARRKIIGVILIVTMVASFCLSGCDITFVLPSSESETSQTEEVTPVVTPEPVISISDDIAPLITEADIAPEEPEYERMAAILITASTRVFWARCSQWIS